MIIIQIENFHYNKLFQLILQKLLYTGVDLTKSIDQEKNYKTIVASVEVISFSGKASAISLNAKAYCI